MTRKRMSLRAIARMKRENRELRDRLAVAYRVEQRTFMTRWTGVAKLCTEVQTIRKLGFVVEIVDDGDDVVTTTAVRKRDA